MLDDFTRHDLDGLHDFWTGRLPEPLIPDDEAFEALWTLHPEDFHEIHIHGRKVKTPRWQQAFGADYHYTGQTNRALPLTDALRPFLEWACACVDPRLNGLLLNWYDGTLGHYIGRHRDSITDMIPGAPIVTISLGQERTFRLRPWKGRQALDFPTPHGAVFALPYATNLAWTHEVPASKRATGRRISITLRAFQSAATPP